MEWPDLPDEVYVALDMVPSELLAKMQRVVDDWGHGVVPAKGEDRVVTLLNSLADIVGMLCDKCSGDGWICWGNSRAVCPKCGGSGNSDTREPGRGPGR